MGDHLNIPIAALIAIVSLTGMMSVASAGPLPVSAASVEVRHCSVGSTGQCSVAFNLVAGDQVVGTVSSSVGRADPPEVWVTSPSDVTLYRSGIFNGSVIFTFTAYGPGTYNLHFDSHLAATAGQVTVSYAVYPPADC